MSRDILLPFYWNFTFIMYPFRWPLLLTLIFINSNVSNIFPPHMKKAELFIINLSVVCSYHFLHLTLVEQADGAVKSMIWKMSEQSEVSSESVLCVISCENLTNMTLSHFSSFFLACFSLRCFFSVCISHLEVN